MMLVRSRKAPRLAWLPWNPTIWAELARKVRACRMGL